MKKAVLLSICIATYNRPHAVKRLLESMVGQITPEVEVIVRDDSTTDETKRIVGKYGKLFPIAYIHGKKEGLDGAILFLTERAGGKYIWWLGDDTLVPDAVVHVASLLTQHPELSFVWVNHRFMPSGTLAVDLGGDRFFGRNEEVLEEIVGGLGFISATIIERVRALSGLVRARAYLGSAFVNLHLALHVLAQKAPSYFLQGPFLNSYPLTSEEIKAAILRGDILSKPSHAGTIRNDGFEVFGVTFRNIVLEFRDKFDRRSIRRILTRNFSHVWRGILVGWVGGWDSPHGKRFRLLRFYWSYSGAWVAFVCMLLPRPLVALLYRFYIRLRKVLRYV